MKYLLAIVTFLLVLYIVDVRDFLQDVSRDEANS